MGQARDASCRTLGDTPTLRACETVRTDFLDRAQWGVRADTFATSTVYLDGPETIYVRAD